MLAEDLNTSYLILRDLRAWIDRRGTLVQWYGSGVRVPLRWGPAPQISHVLALGEGVTRVTTVHTILSI